MKIKGLSVYINFLIYRGQSPAEADLNLLETSRRCELYGMKMHPAKVKVTSMLLIHIYIKKC